jgi:hypothetical protein
MNPTDSNGHDWRQRMDRVDRAIEGILHVQATHDARIADLHNFFGRVLTAVESLTLKVADIADAQRQLTEAQRRTDEKLAQLADAQRQLADAQRHTDDRLNALIAVVDDFIRRQRPPSS